MSKYNNNCFKSVPCIIGVDQSYTRTGIAIIVNGEIKKIGSINFTNHQHNKTTKRLEVRRVVGNTLDACLIRFKPDEIVVLCERIRTFTSSFDIRPDFMISQGALVACLVDEAYVRGVKTFSVDTRAWKSKVLGTSKPIFEPLEGVENPQKFGSVRKMIELGFGEEIKRYKGNGKGKEWKYDDDAADAACIGLYGFAKGPLTMTLET